MADPFGIVGGCLLLITSLILLGATSVSWHGIAVPSRGPYITVSRFPRLYAAGSIITLLLFVTSGVLTTVRASSSRIAPERATRAVRLLLAFGRLGVYIIITRSLLAIMKLSPLQWIALENHRSSRQNRCRRARKWLKRAVDVLLGSALILTIFAPDLVVFAASCTVAAHISASAMLQTVEQADKQRDRPSALRKCLQVGLASGGWGDSLLLVAEIVPDELAKYFVMIGRILLSLWLFNSFVWLLRNHVDILAGLRTSDTSTPPSFILQRSDLSLTTIGLARRPHLHPQPSVATAERAISTPLAPSAPAIGVYAKAESTWDVDVEKDPFAKSRVSIVSSVGVQRSSVLFQAPSQAQIQQLPRAPSTSATTLVSAAGHGESLPRHTFYMGPDMNDSDAVLAIAQEGAWPMRSRSDVSPRKRMSHARGRSDPALLQEGFTQSSVELPNRPSTAMGSYELPHTMGVALSSSTIDVRHHPRQSVETVDFSVKPASRSSNMARS